MARGSQGRAHEDEIVRISVRAKPRAKRSRVLRAEGLSIDVALAAPPVDGAANDELVDVLSAALSLPKKQFELVMGASSKTKVVAVRGLDAALVVARLALAVESR